MSQSWSKNKDHWKSLPEHFLNGNWKKVNYVSGDISRVPNKGGIYMYCVSIPKSKNEILESIGTPIYMGISKKLKRRFTEHLDKDEIIEMADCFGNRLKFFFLTIDPYVEKNVKIEFEQPMIDCFGKVVNRINSVVKYEKEDVSIEFDEFKPI